MKSQGMVANAPSEPTYLMKLLQRKNVLLGKKYKQTTMASNEMASKLFV